MQWDMGQPSAVEAVLPPRERSGPAPSGCPGLAVCFPSSPAFSLHSLPSAPPAAGCRP